MWTAFRKKFQLEDYPIWHNISDKRDIRYGKAMFEYAWTLVHFRMSTRSKISMALVKAICKKHDVDPVWLTAYLCEVTEQRKPK